MIKRLQIVTLVSLIMMSTHSIAAPKLKGEPKPSQLTWDLGASGGSYGGVGYTEANLGLNWKFLDYLTWRNALFARMPSGGSNVYGLDTSLRFETHASTEEENFGISLFGGPGYRISSGNNTAAFAEAGLVLKLGGLHVGGGARVFYYSNPGLDSAGLRLPNQDTQIFLILSGGGTL